MTGSKIGSVIYFAKAEGDGKGNERYRTSEPELCTPRSINGRHSRLGNIDIFMTFRAVKSQGKCKNAYSYGNLVRNLSNA